MRVFTGLWPLFSHLTEAGMVVVALLAAAWLSPIFKKEFVYAAACVGFLVVVYTMGIRDEKHRRDALEQAIQTDVDSAVRGADGKGKDPFDDPRN